MSDLIPYIHHETQVASSMLCAQHALNNLLQQTYFTPQDLASIGDELDRQEKQVEGMYEGRGEGEGNYDDTGFFSLGVMQEALKIFGLTLVHWGSEELKQYRNHPEMIEGYVMNHQNHWYTIRRFASADRFYNLDSCIPQPTWISSTYLGMTLKAAQQQNYTIFACVPTSASGLPPCEADTMAQHLPPPRGNQASTSTSTSSHPNLHLPGRPISAPTLATARTYSNNGRGKRRQDADDLEISSESDDDIIIMDQGVESSGTSTSSHNGRTGHSRKRQRGSLASAPGLNITGRDGNENGHHGEISEEDQMAKAIAESLQAAKSSKASSSTTNLGNSAEDELQRALKNSLLDDVEVDEEDYEQDDTPTMEELRLRRLQRFGAG